MRIEFWVFLLTAGFVYDAYHEGKYMKKLFTYKKYYTMAFYGILGIGLILLLGRKNPVERKQLLSNANNMIRYMPIDKTSMALLNPLFDLTNNSSSSSLMEEDQEAPSLRPSGPTKRSVSETKKKFVASNQDWKCSHCKSQLDHTYEIDHRLRLEYGGSNDLDNLVALCRNCHGKKTASEIMQL